MADEPVVRVEWQGPLALAEVLKLDGADDYGIYQIIGIHLVFGPSSLLYVGSAANQTFKRRFTQHQDDGLTAENEVSLRIGRIATRDRPVRRRVIERVGAATH